jgi:hypothetical protein
MLCRDEIIAFIMKHDLKVGDVIPSINQLIDMLGAARTNVQNALKQLYTEGILDKRPGSGCYLKELPVTAPAVPLASLPSMTDYLSGPMALHSTGCLRLGVLQEMRNFPEMWQALTREFHRESGIKVEIMPFDSMDELQNSMPDVFQIPNYMIADMVEKELLLSNYELGVSLNATEFIPGAKALIHWQGKDWGVPMVCGCGCMFYNRELVDMSVILADKSGLINTLRYFQTHKAPEPAAAWTLNCYLLCDFLKLAGVSAHQTSTEMLKTFQRPECVELIAQIEEFMRDENIFYGSVTQTFSSSVRNFKNRQITSILGNTSIMLQTFADVDFPVEIVSPPGSDKGGGELVSFVNVVSAKTLKREECVIFQNFLAQEDTQRAFAAQGRPVAHNRALDHLALPFADEASCRSLAETLRRATPTMIDHREHTAYAIPKLLEESNRWQRGQITLPQFIDIINNLLT